MKPFPSRDEILEWLTYEPSTGLFSRKKTRTSRNYPVGFYARGYHKITVPGFGQIFAHRVAWVYMTGALPTNEIDHIDGNPSNNRWDNLREADRVAQGRNAKRRKDNKSGRKGVSWDKDLGKWRVDIVVRSPEFKKRRIFLGSYDDVDAAGLAYVIAAEKYFGEFARFE